MMPAGRCAERPWLSGAIFGVITALFATTKTHSEMEARSG